MSKHTPGPWIGFQDATMTWVKQDGHADLNPFDQRYICTLKTDSPAIDMANARLIAAAPEMLEALLAVIEASAKLPPGMSYVFTKQALAAIEKAKGDL